MNRREYYFKQAVTESELNDGFAQAENADHALMTDQALVGIFSGGSPAQHSPLANLTIDVGAPMYAYDNFGQRIYIPGPLTNVNVAQDSSSVSTAVAGGGNEKYLSIAAKFARALSDPRVDGNSNTIYFVENESFTIVVTQGAEAAVGTATRPALDPDTVLICDVHRTFGQTQVFNADIDATTRRQDVFVLAGAPISIRAGTLLGAVQANLTALNNHINSLGLAHPASAIAMSPLGNWADGTTNIYSDLFSFLNNGLVTELATSGGTAKIMGAAWPALATGDVIASNPLSTQLAAFVTALAAHASVAHHGAKDIGYSPASSSTPLTSTDVGAALAEIDGNFHTFITTGLPATGYHWTAAQTFDSLAMTAGHSYGLSSRSVTRTQQSGFTLGVAGGYFLASQDVPANDVGQTVLDLPHNAVLTKIAVLVLPLNGTPPAGAKNKIQLTKWNLSTGAQTNSFTTLDPTTGASYGTTHAYDTGTISETIDRTLYRYTLNLIGETGAGANEVFLYGFTTTYTVTGIDDGVA